MRNYVKLNKVKLLNGSDQSDCGTFRSSTPRKMRRYMEGETESCRLVTLKLQILKTIKYGRRTDISRR